MSTYKTDYKLFMILLGSKAPQRNVEQHDFFFVIGKNLKELVPAMKEFWPEAGKTLHIDGWREVRNVDGYQITVSEKVEMESNQEKRLFFVNLGGYTGGKLEEQHYTVLTVQADKATATQEAKKTIFFRTNTMKGATSHIDDKYGVDVDDIFQIEDILLPKQKDQFQINISKAQEPLPEDEITLGYFKLDKLDKFAPPDAQIL